MTTVGVVALVAGALVLLAVGGIAGYAVRGEPEHSASEQLEAAQIGNVAEGRELFAEYQCSACHSYRGRGGSDGPPLDTMRGQMTAQSIANMSGNIWNHVPQMRRFFREEGLEFPTFTGNQMADLVAYLHGGGAPPEEMEHGHTGDEKDHMEDGHSTEEATVERDEKAEEEEREAEEKERAP